MQLFCYNVGNEKDQLPKPNTKFHVKLKPYNLDKYIHYKEILQIP